METKSVGDKIREARKDAHRSVEWLAKQVGCSQSAISQIERGARLPKMRLLKAIAKSLNISAYMLCTDEYISEHELEDGQWGMARLAEHAQKYAMSEQECMLLLHSYGKLKANARTKALAYIVDLAKIPEYTCAGEGQSAGSSAQ